MKKSSAPATVAARSHAGARTTSTPTPATPVTLRRTPSQKRGQVTVEAVLQAASREIATGGLDKLTTKRIAEAAGLSVGAVYGYFPNKQAIVLALLARWNARVFEAVDSIHPRFGTGLDLLTYLNRQIDLAARVYEEQPGLGAMFDMMPAMPTINAAIERHDGAVRDSLLSAMQHYLPNADPAELEAGATAIPAICHELMMLAVSAPADTTAAPAAAPTAPAAEEKK